MVIKDVNGTIGAGVVADGLRNIFNLIDLVEAPTTILPEGRGGENQDPIGEIEFPEH
jgi:hypothetical protein